MQANHRGKFSLLRSEYGLPSTSGWKTFSTLQLSVGLPVWGSSALKQVTWRAPGLQHAPVTKAVLTSHPKLS